MPIEPRRLTVTLVGGVVLLAGAAFVVNRTVSTDTTTTTTPTSTASEAAPAGPDSANLSIESFAFDPDVVKVAPGATVSVTNRDDATHTVTSGMRDTPDGLFNVTVDPAGTASFAAPVEAGDYPFVCMIHPGMKATIQVAP